MALRGVYKITGIVDNPVLFLFTPTGLKSLSREKYLLSVSGMAGSDLGAAFIGMSRSGSLDSLATLHRRGTVRQALLTAWWRVAKHFKLCDDKMFKSRNSTASTSEYEE